MDLHSAELSMQESEFPVPLNGFVLSGNKPVLFASANVHVLPTRTSEHLLHAHEFMVPIPEPMVINPDHSSSVNSYLLHEPQTEPVLPMPHNEYLPRMNENEHLLPTCIPFSEHMSPMLANEHVLPTASNDNAFTVPMRNIALPVSRCEPELPSSTSEPVLLVPACDPFNTPLVESVPTMPLNELVLLASSNEHTCMLPQPMIDYVLPVASVDPVLHTPMPDMIDPVHHMPVNRPVLYEPTHYGEPLLHIPMHQNEPLLPISTHHDRFALHVPKYCRKPVLLAHQDEIMYTPMIDAGNFPSSSTASLSPYDSSVENTARCAEENTEDTFEENIEQSIEENIEQSTEKNREHSTVGSKLGSISDNTEDSSEHSTVGSELGSTADSREESTQHCEIGTELQSTADSTEESTEHSTIGSELESTVKGTVDSTEENTDCTEEANESEISMHIASSSTCTSQLLSSPDRTLPLLIAESVLPTTIQPSSFSSQQPKSYTTLVSMKASNTQPSKSNTPLPSRAESAPPSFQPSQPTMPAFPRAESTPPSSIWQKHYLSSLPSWTELVPPSYQPEQPISSVPSHVSLTPLSSQPLQPTIMVPAMLSTQSSNSQPSQQLKSVSSVIEHVPSLPDIQLSTPPAQQPTSTNIFPSPLLIQQPKSPSMPIQQPKSPSMLIQQSGMQIEAHSSPSVTPTVQPTGAVPSPQHLQDLLTSATSFSKIDQMSPELAIQMTKIPQVPSPLPLPPPILPPPPPPCPPAPPPSMAPFNVPSPRHSAAQLSNLNSKLMEPITCKDSKMEEQLDSAISRILFKSDSIGLSCRREVLPILQDGPCCGIVALVMAGQMLGVDSINVYDALALAKDRNYSKQGEMFSAKNMHLLAKELYPTSNCQLVASKSPEITVKIIEHLGQGLPILLPYDADRNHEPCQKKGHKAHWALISGFLGLIDDQNNSALKTLTKDGKISNLYHCKDSKLGQDRLKSLCSDGKIYVYGLQGKSRYTAVWSLDSLLKSNSQLNEVEPERTEDSDSYILPERLDEELCSQMIFLGEERTESQYRMNEIETLNALFSSLSDSLPKAIHLTDTHSEVSFNRKDIVIRNTKGSSEQLTIFWIKVIEHCSSVDCLNESETFTCRKNAVTVYVLKRLGTLIIDGNFLLVDVWYREILQTACSMLTRKDQMMNLFTTQDKTDVKACSATPGFEIEEKLDGHSDHLELTSRDGAKSLVNCASSCDCPMSDQLQALRNACVKDGGTYIYQLWKNLLNKWLSDGRNKVYIATPFLDSGKLKDICKIMIRNQYTANIDKFYVRQKCDDPLYLIDIVRNSTKKFTVAEKMIIKKEVINKMVCDFTSRFHCKFIACVMEDNHAEVLITSANFTRQHFDCSNAESVFYQDMTEEQFQSRFLKPLEAIT